MDVEKKLQFLQTENLDLRQRLYEMEHSYEKMKAEQAIVNLVTEKSKIGTWDWNIRTGDVIYSNNWRSILGYGPDELENSLDTWRSLVHPEDIDSAMSAIDANLCGVTSYYLSEHRLRKKNGAWLWVLAKGTVVEQNENGDPSRHCGVHIDVDASRQMFMGCTLAKNRAERELEELLRRQNVISSLLSNFIYCIDVSTKKILWANGPVQSITGYSIEEINQLPDALLSLAHPEADHDIELPPTQNSNKPNYLEYRIQTRTGETKWISDTYVTSKETKTGELRLMGAIQDVTEFRKMRETIVPDSE